MTSQELAARLTSIGQSSVLRFWQELDEAGQRRLIEQITALDADVAVMFPIGYTVAQLEADPLISSLSVVKDGRTVFLGADDQLTQAYSAASPLSIPIAVAGLAPKLAEVTAG